MQNGLQKHCPQIFQTSPLRIISLQRLRIRRLSSHSETLVFECEMKDETASPSSTLDDLSRSNECMICMESFDELENNKQLKCSHRFHKHCIAHWRKGNMSPVNQQCPLCRESMSFISIIKPLELDAEQATASTQIHQIERIGWINWWRHYQREHIAAAACCIILLFLMIVMPILTTLSTRRYS